MRRPTTALALTAVVVSGSAVAAVTVSAKGDKSDKGKARAVLHDAAGAEIGRVDFKTRDAATTVRVTVDDVTTGFHGFHVHAVGACEAPFTTAGGHYAGAGGAHGTHDGDMPPLLVNDDGSASAQFVTDRFTVSELTDADGSAIIVHAGPDNLANIPSRYQSTTSPTPGPDADTLKTGDAGGRFACGVVEAKGSERKRG